MQLLVLLIIMLTVYVGSVMTEQYPPAPLIVNQYNDPARIQEAKAELRTDRLQKVLKSCDNNGGLKTVAVLGTELSDFSVKKVKITCNSGLSQVINLDK